MKLHAELIFIWKIRTYTRFETEAQENSEMVYPMKINEVGYGLDNIALVWGTVSLQRRII